MSDHGRPRISVLLPTYNRSGLLASSLESLETQTLRRNEFEILIIDDGSTDETPAVCRRFADRLPIRYFRLRHAGTSAAKNLGVFAAAANIVFFFDDDDVAHRNLLYEHVRAHERYSDESAAVLGYTTWAPWMPITELMHYVTEVGQLLFSYPSIPAGRALDFTYFWCGRLSCKRSFLARHGVFAQDFQAAAVEDIELGFRLSKFQLKVYYEPHAISFMNRGITLDEFCRRCEKQGRAYLLFSRRHPDAAGVQQYCDVAEADARWEAARVRLPEAVARVQALEEYVNEGAHDPAVCTELWRLYKFVFSAYRLKGIAETPSALERPDPPPVARVRPSEDGVSVAT